MAITPSAQASEITGTLSTGDDPNNFHINNSPPDTNIANNVAVSNNPANTTPQTTVMNTPQNSADPLLRVDWDPSVIIKAVILGSLILEIIALIIINIRRKRKFSVR